MLNNIQLGTYYPGKSVIHRLQARTKLVIIMWIVGTLFFANQRQWHFAPYIALILLAIAGITLAGISPREIWQRLWFLLVLSAISALFSIFSLQGDSKVLYRIGPVLTSYGWMQRALLLSGGILLVLLISSLLPFLQSVWKRRGLKLLRTLMILVLIGVILLLVWIYWTPPAQPFVFGPLLITYQSVWLLTTSLALLLLLYVFSLLLTMTTLPTALVEGLTLLLSPLRRLKFPVDDFALMTLLALRFIPTLLDEAEQLIKAQAARGADLGHGTLRERVQSMTMFFLPLIRGTLRRATELAVALEARGYLTDGHKTQLYETKLRLADYVAMAIVIFVMIGAILL